jgi:hypothetical protein
VSSLCTMLFFTMKNTFKMDVFFILPTLIMGGRGLIQGFHYYFFGRTLIPVLLAFHMSMFSAYVWIYVVLVYPMNNWCINLMGSITWKFRWPCPIWIYFYMSIKFLRSYNITGLSSSVCRYVCLCNNFTFILPILNF